MTLSIMLLGLGVSAVLALAASVLHAQERAANRPVRWIWISMLGLSVVLTALVPSRQRAAGRNATPLLLDSIAITQSPANADVSRGVAGAIRDIVSAGARAMRFAVDNSLGRAIAIASDVPRPAQRVAAYSWVIASLVSGFTLLLAYRRVRRSTATWTRSRLLGVDVFVSESAGPAVVGLRPMEIVVPSWILGRTEQEQRLVLRHECEHISAFDPALLVIACMGVVAMPWNPFLWYGLSRLRLAVEIDCDRRVLRSGVGAGSYGTLLLDLSAHRSALATLPALSYSASHLERRLLAMTSRPARHPLARRVSGGVIAALLLLAACESRMPTSAEVESMDAKTAVSSIGAMPGVDTARAVFTIDGIQVSKADAGLVASEKIASIEVVKGGNRTPLVRLRTKIGHDSMMIAGTKLTLADSAVVATGATLMLDGKEPVRVQGRPLQNTLSATPMRSKSGFDGVFMLDGKPVSNEVANSINPNSISSVEVVKGEAARLRSSDPRAANGIILITTKKP